MIWVFIVHLLCLLKAYHSGLIKLTIKHLQYQEYVIIKQIKENISYEYKLLIARKLFSYNVIKREANVLTEQYELNFSTWETH